MLHLAVCDDEETQIALLEACVREWAADRKNEIELELYRNAEQLLFHWEEKAEVRIVLLDIDMPGMDGIALARRLREKGAAVQILFITGLGEYALEGYDVEAVSYLIKPVDKKRLFECMDRAVERCGREEPALLAEQPWGAAKVKLKDICYLESEGHDTRIYCTGAEEPVRSRIGIRQLEERIGQLSRAFFKIHRSYLVNLSRVDRITRKEAVMENGKALPIARSRWEALNRAYLAYYRGKHEML